MSFLSKVELKKQIERFGINVEGNYVKKSDIETILADLVTYAKPQDLAKAAFLLHRLPNVSKSKSGVTWATVGTAILLGLSIEMDDIRYLKKYISAAEDLGVKVYKEDIGHQESGTVRDLMKIDHIGTTKLLKQAGISDRDYGPQT